MATFNTYGLTDYIKDGKVVKESKVRSVMVTAKSDLANLKGYNPGDMAYTAGYKNIWQKKADGTWEAIIEEA